MSRRIKVTQTHSEPTSPETTKRLVELLHKRVPYEYLHDAIWIGENSPEARLGRFSFLLATWETPLDTRETVEKRQ